MASQFLLVMFIHHSYHGSHITAELVHLIHGDLCVLPTVGTTIHLHDKNVFNGSSVFTPSNLVIDGAVFVHPVEDICALEKL